uniref:Aminoacylase-1 n=1 Tax=Quercus lobata TaxID=97700 RepID=A0A7N2MK05_QUELO
MHASACDRYMVIWIKNIMFMGIKTSPCNGIKENGPIRDRKGHPLLTPTNNSNPWWSVFQQAITAVGGKLAKPEILASTTDARFMRQLGIPTLGFSPMANTPILLHEHDEFLKDTVYLKGIEVYESIISSLSSFEDNDHVD